MITEKAPTHRAQQKREQILTAARRLFLQHGFADTSTEAIRIEAGVSKETLYRYYASKEGLFTAVLRQLTLEHLPRLVEEIRRLNPQLARAQPPSSRGAGGG